jgi:hypothetical protein
MQQVITFRGLFDAYRDCRKRKRRTANAQRYEMRLLDNAGAYKGLPIGNLTSQFFANVYLNPFDQFVKHTLKCRHYLRYVDDVVLLADNPATLLAWRGQIADFLRDELQLALKALAKPKPVSAGADFLGYVIRPHYRLVRRRVVGNLREKLQVLQTQIVRGYVHSGYTLSLQPAVMAELQATLASYSGHFKHANSHRLQQQIQQEFPWLALLSGYEPAPANLVGYKSQIHFFQQQYPSADLHIQRGMEIDVVKPALLSPPLHVIRADIREYGYLKGGLKRRIVYRLVIQPGVELCPS